MKKFFFIIILSVFIPIFVACICKDIRPLSTYEDTMWVCNEMDAWIHYSEKYDGHNYGEMIIDGKVHKICEYTLNERVEMDIDDKTFFQAYTSKSNDTIKYEIHKIFIYPLQYNELTFTKLQNLDYCNNYTDSNNIISLKLDTDLNFVMSCNKEQIQGTFEQKGKKLALTSNKQVFTFIREDEKLKYDKNSSDNKYNLDSIILQIQ